MSVAAILIGLIAGYIVALLMGQVNFGNIGRAGLFEIPNPFRWGFELNWAIIIGMCLMAIVSAIETVGDVSGITKGGAGREATDKEIQGATFADGLGTAVAGIFGGLPNTSFSQNVGLISMTGVMSRHVVTIGAIFLIVCGFIPKVGAMVSTCSNQRSWRRCDRHVRHGCSCWSFHVGRCCVEPPQHGDLCNGTCLSALVCNWCLNRSSTFRQDLQILLTSGLLPAAVIAIVLNLIIPEDIEGSFHSTNRITPTPIGRKDGPRSISGAFFAL